jgi:3',5'-cyclic AMP phosphodiesterase CpdA
VRLAHCSDLHLLSLTGAHVRDFLGKRWTGGVNLLLHRAKHYRAEVFEALVDDLNAQTVDQVVCRATSPTWRCRASTGSRAGGSTACAPS